MAEEWPFVTDLGYMPELVKVHLRDADLSCFWKSNHDLEIAQGVSLPVGRQTARALPPPDKNLRITRSANIWPTPRVSMERALLTSCFAQYFAGKQ